MEFWLINGSDRFQLPVNPPEIEVSSENNVVTAESLSLGEVNLGGKPKLTTISISSFFPAKYSSLCNYSSLHGALWSAEHIDNWRKADSIIRLIVTGTSINMPCKIQSFKYKWQHGTSDIDFTLELQEYRYMNDKTSSYYAPPASKYSLASKNSSYKRPSAKGSKKPTYYIVKSGDTLASISKKLYGTTNKWRDIASKNNIKNPSSIKTGQRLVL